MQLSYDSEADVAERIEDFFLFNRYFSTQSEDACIFVGHSMFFKTLCKKMSSTLLRNRPILADKLRRFKLGNGSVLAVTVRYGGGGDGSVGGGSDGSGKREAGSSGRGGGSGRGVADLSDAYIEDAVLLMGGSFHQR